MTSAKRSSSRSFEQSGFVVVFTAIALFVLVLLVGFGVDLGSWYLNAAKMQRAADAAALAASAQLPDVDAAQKAATDAYLRNGYKDGDNHIAIKTNITASDVSTTINDSDVTTYFLRMIMPSIGMSRTSESSDPSTAPVLGSPFNVLGTGDLNIPGLSAHQNFWLAVNGICAPKEDGDYFDARYDRTKGPLTPSLNGNSYVPAGNAETHCPNPTTGMQGYPPNPEFENQGYSYFINVPKPPSSVSNPTVKIEIYDPQMDTDSKNPPLYYDAPDFVSTMPQDDTFAGGYMAWDLYNTNGTPMDPTDDTEILPHPVAMGGAGDDGRWTPHTWWTMYTIPAVDIANGGQFRVQVVPMESYNTTSEPSLDAYDRGVDAFSVGAFASWESNGSVSACNSDNDINCPRVYGLGAVSVYNSISGGGSSGSDDFYLADITPQYVGQTFDVMLWDPGEGTQGIQLVAPNGTPLSFTYTSGGSSPGDVGPSSASAVTTLDTSGVDGHAIDPVKGVPTLSNNYLFNDRLVTLQVTIPVNYSSLAVGNDNWLRLRYLVSSSSPNDRTTWGIATPGAGSGGPAHLSLPGT